MSERQGLPVAVVGGGIAGLTAAAALRRRGIPVALYEAGSRIAGMAESFRDADGFSYDVGAHFITNRLAAAVGIGALCRDIPRYDESVLLAGRSHAYPFGLMAVPRFVAGALRARAGGAGRLDRAETAAEWFRAGYGRPLADEVALPLVQAWSGAPADALSAAVGRKLHTSGRVGSALRLKLASRLTGRAVSCGYCNEAPENPNVWHVYPRDGLGVLCGRLAVELGDAIRLDSPVERILVEDGRVVAVRVHGHDRPVAAAVSTAPVPILAKLVSGSAALEPLRQFRYRPMVFVNLRFSGRGLLRDTVLWTPEPGFPFFRLTETPISMPWLAPEGKTLVTADIGCSVGDAVWSMEDEALGELCLNHLEPVIRDARRRYLGCRVVRTPIAYPVFLREYEADRQRFERGTGIDGLLSVGRNGEFAHILMEDIYWRTLNAVRGLAGQLLAGDAPWSTEPAAALVEAG
jgi:oxygen-dependent protoporphyrinogen oxidase